MQRFKYLMLGAAIVSAPIAFPAGAATYFDDLRGGAVAGFDRNVAPADGRYAEAPTADGIVFTRAAGSGDGGIELLSRFTFTGAFRITVDVAGLATGLDTAAEAGLGIKGPGCCANRAFADVFGYGNTIRANNYLGLTELSANGIADGTRLGLAGDTGGAAYRLNLFLDQEFGGTAANQVTFTNLSVTADGINAGVPEPSTWSFMLIGFGLAGMLVRQKGRPVTTL